VKVRFALALPAGTTMPVGLRRDFSISPDGHNIAMVLTDANGKTALWVRPLGSATARRLDNTEGASAPFWSPDGQFIAFFVDDNLKKIPSTGGSAQTLCEARGASAGGDGGAWNAAGFILFSTGLDSPLMRVQAAGGSATPATRLDTAAGENRHSWPQFLPDGRHVLYFAGNRDLSRSATYVQELGSSARTEVMRNVLHASWSASGYLVFARGESLYAQHLDPKSLRLTGEPVPLAEGIFGHNPSGRVPFAVSGGVLVYRTSPNTRMAQLAWYGRDGKRLAAVGAPGVYLSVSISPDDRSAALCVGWPRADLWMLDLTSGGLRRMTNEGQMSFVIGPWSSDSQRLAVNLANSKGILDVTAGSGQTRPFGPAPYYADAWSLDGQSLIVRDTNGDQWSLLKADGSQQVQPIPNAPTRGMYVRFAPDGKLVAYSSLESGRAEVMVASFPSFAERRQVSTNGGTRLNWVKNELLFQATDGTVMSTVIRTAGGKIEASVPKPLFKLQPQVSGSGSSLYWPTSDGQRFLVLERERPDSPAQVMTVLNWAAELKQ
jgi:Tol biopolymer transport system component